MAFATFERLTGQDVIAVARKLHPGLADTPVRAIHNHDALFARGLMRDWATTATWLRTFSRDTGVTPADLARVRSAISSGATL